MDKDNLEVEELDCAVCLQKCHYPTQLPCGHIFCFLCLKGVAVTTKKCAMCRALIPSDYLNHPDVLKIDSKETPTDFQWYYEGGNGWWKYEDRHNEELENSYTKGDNQCKLLIAGELYYIDFRKMVQIRIRDACRRRRVRRDSPTMPAKGIAGIKIGNALQTNKDEVGDNDDHTGLHTDGNNIYTNNREEISSEQVEDLLGMLSHAVLAGKTLYVSGLLGKTKKSDLVYGGVEAEARQSLNNLEHVLKAGGASLQSVLKTTILLKDIADFPTVNKVYQEFFPANSPARATFQVAKLLARARIEIEAVAISGGVIVGEACTCSCEEESRHDFEILDLTKSNNELS